MAPSKKTWMLALFKLQSKPTTMVFKRLKVVRSGQKWSMQYANFKQHSRWTARFEEIRTDGLRMRDFSSKKIVTGLKCRCESY
jgi:hypothetical protein